MIPKKIHYVWLGNEPRPPLSELCLSSWRQYCPDWEVIEWNESSIDLSTNDYIRQAYSAKRWAFVSDYMRLYALVNHGGVYLDTDCELLKPIDRFLSNQAIAGFQSTDYVQTALLGCHKGFPLFADLLSSYNNKNFFRQDGSTDLTTNVEILTNYLLERGLLLNGCRQTIDGLSIYPTDYFCPPRVGLLKKYRPTNNTYAVHHFAGSWETFGEKQRNRLNKRIFRPIKNILGNT